MDYRDRIHCDNIVVCTPERLQDEIDKRFSNKLVSRRVLKKYMRKFRLNYKKDPDDDRDFKLKVIKPKLLDESARLGAPNKVDHAADMSPVKDQGQLGSCVGFAVSAMKECQERKEHLEEIAKGKRGRPKVYDYSEAWIYWNAKQIDPWGVEDEGTSIRYAMKVLQRIGVPTEKGWPYKDINDVDAIGEPARWASMVARWALIDSYYRIDNLNDLKLALVNGPVPIGIPCFYEIFFTSGDGIIPYPASPDEIYGGHAVCAVGYDNDKQRIKFKNSWGTNWGQNGYGYLSYKYINDFLWDAWAAKDLAVTRDMLKGVRTLG